MFRLSRAGAPFAAVLVACAMMLGSVTDASAHARYDRSEPPSGAALDGSPFVLKAWFTQELTSKSTMRVVDASGVQVDLGDGHVDLDDPIRKTMLVSLPALPPGIYRVEFGADSAEDGHMYPGAFAFGVGMEAPAGALDATQVTPVDVPAAAPETPAVVPEAAGIVDAY